MPSPPRENTQSTLPNIKSLSDENLPATASRMNVKYSFDKQESSARAKFLPGFANYDPPVGLLDSSTSTEPSTPRPFSPGFPDDKHDFGQLYAASPTSPSSAASVDFNHVSDGFSPYVPQLQPPLQSSASTQSLPSLPTYESLDIDDIERERNPDGFCSEALHVEPVRPSSRRFTPASLPPLDIHNSNSNSSQRRANSVIYFPEKNITSPPVPNSPPPAYGGQLLKSLQRSNTIATFSAAAAAAARNYSSSPSSSSKSQTPTTQPLNRVYDVLSHVNASTPGLSHSADRIRPLQVKSAFTTFFKSFNFSPSPFPHKYLQFEFPDGRSVRIPWSPAYKDTMKGLWELVVAPQQEQPAAAAVQNTTTGEDKRLCKNRKAATALSYSGLPMDVLGNIWEYALSFVKPERRMKSGDGGEEEEGEEGGKPEGWLTGLEFVVMTWIVGLHLRKREARRNSGGAESGRRRIGGGGGGGCAGDNEELGKEKKRDGGDDVSGSSMSVESFRDRMMGSGK